MRCKPVTDQSKRLLHWLSRSPGYELAIKECAFVEKLCTDLFGCYLLQVGCDKVFNTQIMGNHIRQRVILEQEMSLVGSPGGVLGKPDAMPIATDSIDVVFLPHVLEFSAHPQQVLQEASRVLVAGGHLVILGFNPFSVLGMYHLFRSYSKEIPWCGRFISPSKLAFWLAECGLQVEQQRFMLFLPPLQCSSLLWRLRNVEPWIKNWLPMDRAVYGIKAVKRTHIVTPLWSTKVYATRPLVATAFEATTVDMNNEGCHTDGNPTT